MENERISERGDVKYIVVPVTKTVKLYPTLKSANEEARRLIQSGAKEVIVTRANRKVIAT